MMLRWIVELVNVTTLKQRTDLLGIVCRVGRNMSIVWHVTYNDAEVECGTGECHD